MRLSATATVLGTLIALATGCGPGSYDTADIEVDDFIDGKADSVVRPSGTYVSHDSAPGIVSLTLNADHTFVRDNAVVCITAPCDPIQVSGAYRFTKSGSHRYIRFRDEQDQFIDRHEYQLSGSILRLRQDGSTEWRTLQLRTAGEIVRGSARFIDSADGMECAMPSVHCVTRDHSACPQLSPLPPDFCSDGEIVKGEAHFIASADGRECAMPSVHCVTRDHSACPQLSPLPPDFCSDGEIVKGETHFIASADGRECAMPSVHCVTRDHSACPQLSPLPPDFCS